MMTIANIEEKNIFKKYKRPEEFEPLKGKVKTNHFVKCFITFNDDSNLTVVMTSRQRNAIDRTTLFKKIKTISGQGLVIPKTK